MEAGEVVAGRYRLVNRLGQGGMGEVWRAEQTALGREVALKLVQEGVSQSLAGARARFQREAELAAQIEHRNVVDIIDYGTTDEGAQYLVMPLLKGEGLDARLSRQPPSIVELLGWMRGVLGGLAAMHDKGVVHRDLKPANVFLAQDADGVVPKLLDFGISRREGAEGAGLTAMGTAIGTPRYMAPEQFESARDVDARADVWSAGAMLYEALAGRAPYESDDAFAIYRAILQSEPPRLESLRGELAVELCDLVHRALSRDPQERFPTARAMRERLDELIAAGTLGADVLRLVAHSPTATPDLAPTVAATPTPAGAMKPSSTKAMSVGGSTVAAVAPTQAMESPGAAAPIGDAPRARSNGLAFGLGFVILLAGATGGAVWLWSQTPEDERDPIVAASDPETDAGSTPVDAAVVAAPTPAAPAGLVVSGTPTPLPDLALHWAGLPETLRASEARFVEEPSGWVEVVPATTPPEVLAALSRGLGGREMRPRDYDPELGLRPGVARTRVRLNLRQGASIDSDVLRTLPHDAVVVTLHGTVQGQSSAPEGDAAMSYFVVARNIAGWSRPRYLVPYHGCVADPYALAEDLEPEEDEDYPDEDPDQALDDADETERMVGTTVVARTHAFIEGRRQEVFIFATSSQRDREGVVGVYRTSGECEVERISLYRVPGLLDEHFLTETLGTGGQTLVMISYSDGQPDSTRGFMQWRAYRLGSDAIVWSARLPTAAYLDDRHRAGIGGTRDRAGNRRNDDTVISVREPGNVRTTYLWDGTAVVPSETPAPAQEPAQAQ